MRKEDKRREEKLVTKIGEREGAMTFRKTAFSISTLIIMTFNITIKNPTLSIMTFNIYAECHLCSVA